MKAIKDKIVMDDAKKIIINEIAQGDASLIKITDVKTVSEKEYKDAMEK